MFSRSPSEASSGSTASARFVTGVDSPVSAASSVESSLEETRRRSAGTESPASSSTMSPGTSARAGRIDTAPSRTTFAVGAAIFERASSAASARRSWKKPSSALTTTMSRMAAVSLKRVIQLPSASVSATPNETSAATSSAPTRGSAS